MKDLKIYKNDLFELGVTLENGEAVFDAEGIARNLGFVQSKNDKDYIRWERMNEYLKDFFLNNKGLNKYCDKFNFSPQVGKGDLIPENLVYLLAMKANNDKAIKFQMWLANDVIPDIRKHGAYMTNDTIEKALKDPDFLIKLATNLKEEKIKRVKAEQERNKLIHQGKLYTATELAKELGFSSPQAFNKELEARKIQYKVNKTWVLCARYAENGYTSIKQIEKEDGTVIYDRKWTGKGRDFLLSIFREDIN